MSSISAILPEVYTLKTGAPDPKSYNNLRRSAGLTPTTEAQAVAGISGAWCAYHIVHNASSTPVAMGRVIGDGGWYFHVIDMATLPEHQRKGLGKVILAALLEKIRKEAPPGAYVNLLADPRKAAVSQIWVQRNWRKRDWDGVEDPQWVGLMGCDVSCTNTFGNFDDERNFL